MIITKTNSLLGITPAILADGAAGETPANITDPDHSTTYTSGSIFDNFKISFGPLSNITYVGISGHNASTAGTGSIVILDDGVTIDTINLARNNNILSTFGNRNFTDLQIEFVTNPTTCRVTVSYVAAGTHLDISTGEQAGYSRNWLNRSLVQSAATSFQAAPTSTMQKRKPLKGSLRLPNELIAFSQGDWQTFIDFSLTQPFFIKEINTEPTSTYLCFNPTFKTVAHQSTRNLDSLSLSFLAYNGL